MDDELKNHFLLSSSNFLARCTAHVSINISLFVQMLSVIANHSLVPVVSAVLGMCVCFHYNDRLDLCQVSLQLTNYYYYL